MTGCTAQAVPAQGLRDKLNHMSTPLLKAQNLATSSQSLHASRPHNGGSIHSRDMTTAKHPAI